MVKSELKRRNTAVWIYLISLALLYFTKKGSSMAVPLALVAFLSFMAASAFYLRAKERSLWWLLLTPGNLIAIFVYYCLEDLSSHEGAKECPSCTAANLPGALQCRLCKRVLPRTA